MASESHPVDLRQFIADAGTRLFRDLVRHHLEAAESSQDLAVMVLGESLSLPEGLRGEVEGLIDAYNEDIFGWPEFWEVRCDAACSQILSCASDHFASGSGVPRTLDGITDTKSNSLAAGVFQIAVIHAAYTASTDERFAKFSGITPSWWPFGRSLVRKMRAAILGRTPIHPRNSADLSESDTTGAEVISQLLAGAKARDEHREGKIQRALSNEVFRALMSEGGLEEVALRNMINNMEGNGVRIDIMTSPKGLQRFLELWGEATPEGWTKEDKLIYVGFQMRRSFGV